MAESQKQIIAFQGARGAYSDQACRDIFPDGETLPCTSFRDAFDAVKKGTANFAVLPIDNTLAGRVADVHHLLPKSGLSIVGEHFLPIQHCLLGVKSADLNQITHVHSHVHALPQCREFIQKQNLTEVVHADTAGAARDIANWSDNSQAAIASELAAEEYDLDILVKDIQDDDRNKTRFIVLAPEALGLSDDYISDALVTSFVFQVRNIPAALYKALGGFATNGVNMLKLESYVDHGFNAAQFYCEVVGHSEDKSLSLALEELSFFAKDVAILGTFPKSKIRDSL